MTKKKSNQPGAAQRFSSIHSVALKGLAAPSPSSRHPPRAPDQKTDGRCDSLCGLATPLPGVTGVMPQCPAGGPGVCSVRKEKEKRLFFTLSALRLTRARLPKPDFGVKA